MCEFYEALFGLLNPIDKEVWCLDLQFHLETFPFWWLFVLCEQQSFILSCFTDHASSPRPPFSLTIHKNQYKNNRNRSEKSFLNKNKRMYGWNLQNPTKLDWDDTTILLLHPYVLCHFANSAPHKTLYMHITYSHPLNEHGTQYCSLHSLPHRRLPYVPCPAAGFHSIT